jgi:hypothetical protein
MCQNLDLRFLHFIAFYQVFFHALFSLFWLSVLLSFLLFLFGFLSPFVFPLFFALVLYIFFVHVVSSLAYPTCLRIKGLGGVVVVTWGAQTRNWGTQAALGVRAENHVLWCLNDGCQPKGICDGHESTNFKGKSRLA